MLSRDFQRPTTQGDDEDWSPDGDISTRGSSTLSFGGGIIFHRKRSFTEVSRLRVDQTT